MSEDRRGAGGPGGRPGGRPPRRFGSGGSSSGGGRSFARRRMDPLTGEGIVHVDYKDVAVLRRFISDRGKIEPRRRVSTSAKHQRSLAIAIKRARHLGLLPFTEGVRDGRERGGRGGRDRDRGPRPGGFDRGPRRFDQDGPRPSAPRQDAPPAAEGSDA